MFSLLLQKSSQFESILDPANRRSCLSLHLSGNCESKILFDVLLSERISVVHRLHCVWKQISLCLLQSLLPRCFQLPLQILPGLLDGILCSFSLHCKVVSVEFVL